MKENITKQIADDLRIKKQDFEQQDQFEYRLIYSAIGKQILSSLWQNIISDKVLGISKLSLKKEIYDLVEIYLRIFPNLSSVLNEEMVDDIIDMLVVSGNIEIDIYSKNYIPAHYEVGGNKNITLVRGDGLETQNSISGIGSFLLDESNSELSDIQTMFQLQEANLKEIYDYLDELPKRDIFDWNLYSLNMPKNKKKTIINWWIDNDDIKGLSLVRKKDGSKYKYYVYRGQKRAKLNDKLLNRREGYYVYRLAILKKYGYNIAVEYSQLGDLIKYKERQDWPLKEKNLFRLYSWPTIKDKSIRLMNKELFEYLKETYTEMGYTFTQK